MKWVIVKKVYGCKYYWNDKKKQWEGLIDNATKYKTKKDANITINKQNSFAETQFHNAVKLFIMSA